MLDFFWSKTLSRTTPPGIPVIYANDVSDLAEALMNALWKLDILSMRMIQTSDCQPGSKVVFLISPGYLETLEYRDLVTHALRVGTVIPVTHRWAWSNDPFTMVSVGNMQSPKDAGRIAVGLIPYIFPRG